MPEPPPASKKVPRPDARFGDFEFFYEGPELRRHGEIIRLQQQPARVLRALLRRAGQVVSRDELRLEVWGEGVFVDFDDALNHCIKFIRDALGDDPGEPQYVETIPRRGYRFIFPLTPADEEANPATAAVPQLSSLRIILLSLLGISFLAGWALRTAPAPRVLNVVRLTHFGLATSVFSDGAHLYVGQQKGGRFTIVQFPREGGSDPVPFPTPFTNVQLLDISPDRKELLVASFAGATDPRLVWVLPLAGGSPRRLGSIESGSARWSPDGARVAFDHDDAVYVANRDGSAIRKIAEHGGGLDGWTADQQWVRFTRTNSATGGSSVWEARTDGTTLRPVLPERQETRARWGEGQCCVRSISNGRYALFREAFSSRVGLWALASVQPFLSLHRAQPVELYAAGFDIMGLSVADHDRVLIVGSNEGHELVHFDVHKQEFVPYLPSLAAASLTWSPDRQSVAFNMLPDLSLWKAKPDGSQRTQLTFPPLQAFGRAWSPNGQQLVFHGLLPGKPGKLYLLSAQGGTPQPLFADQSTAEDGVNWSADGKVLMFERSSLDRDGNTTSTSICMYDLNTRQISVLPESQELGPPSWSPDGRYVAAQSGDFHALMLFDFQSRKWTTVAHGGFIHLPTWTQDGRFLYFQDTKAGEEQPIYRIDLASGKIETIASRKQVMRADVNSLQFRGLTPAGELLAVVVRRDADVYAMDLELPH